MSDNFAHTDPTRRVLFITYPFPPAGGAGVQRPTKFAKYLRDHGWEPTVLTVANPSVPLTDESLLRDLPEDLRIERARTLEPGYRFKRGVAAKGTANSSRPGILSRIKSGLRSAIRGTAMTVLQPDPQVLWNRAATATGDRILREVRHNAIFVTAPPFSSLLIGRKLAERHELPLILDFRDEWDLSSRYLENARRDRFSDWIQNRMKTRVMRSAAAIIGTTPDSTHRLADDANDRGGNPLATCIYNGFDPCDFEELPQPADVRPSESLRRFRIVYTGTLWNLTDITPLARAIDSLAESAPDVLPNLELVIVGRKTPEQQAILDRIAGTSVRLELREYCPHAEAIEMMASSDALCLTLADSEGADRVMPAKAFEYLAVRRRILSIIPDGAARDVVGPLFPESTFRPSETERIARWLAARSRDVHRPPVTHIETDLAPFVRSHQAGQLAGLLDRVTADNRAFADQPQTAGVAS